MKTEPGAVAHICATSSRYDVVLSTCLIISGSLIYDVV